MPLRTPLLAAFLALSAASASSDAVGETVSYQIHSYNDLRSWPQLLQKSLPSTPYIMLKVDPQYLTEQSCALQTRVDPATASRGCLVLNHDTVSAKSRSNMNTTNDLLRFLASDDFAPIFRNSSRAVHISLCFKGCGGGQCPCDGSAASSDWMSTVDAFFVAAQNVVNASGLNVEFLLDGESNPGQHTCLADRWRPVESMFISGDDPSGAFTQDDASKGWDRLVVLNEPAGPLWTVAAGLRFGKFAARARPFIVWEPSDAAGMLAAVKTYAEADGAPHSGGFRNAINTDIATWATHTAPATGQWWRASAPGPSGNASFPRTTPLLAVTQRASGDNLALALTRSKGGGWRFSTFAFATAKNASLPLALSTGSLPTNPASISATSLVLRVLANGTCVAILSGPSGAATYLVDVVSGDVSFGAAFPPQTEAVAAAHAFWGDGFQVSELLVVDSQSEGCALELTLGALGSAPAATVCAVVTPLGEPQQVSASLASFAKGGSVDVQLAGVVTYSIGGSLFAVTLCATARQVATTLRINDPDCFGPISAVPGGSLRPPAAWQFAPGSNASLPLYVGGASGISLLATPSGGPEGGQRVNIMVLTAESHCANNEPDNKRADMGLCDVRPPIVTTGSPYVAFVTSAAAAFTAALLGADDSWRDAMTGGAGACSPLVATGMVTSGASSAPAPSFFLASDGGLEVIALIEGPSDVSDPRSCGTTEPSPGDVNILSWPLPGAYL